MNDPVQQIFSAARPLAPGDRSKLLDAQCGSETAIRREVESLLAAHDNAGEFLAEPTADYRVPHGSGELALSEGPGTTIGRYKLLQQIGEGGFGVVYMAQQTEPVKRRVALKIIKLGMDTKQVVARFEAERQALAMMDHPHIARVLDGGATQTGRPYFVMELVRGDPITQYCDDRRLSTRQRLELFLQVCHAVQHAHQKGIIHRDIKPSNVLVTVADDQPLVKVIDFGIAKATNSELTEKTLFTEFRQLIGTPAYMSPEQSERSGVDIDTRSDIYALGVLLYEMLTGTTPFDSQRMRSAAWGELQRIIREEEPPAPSTRVSANKSTLAEVARCRNTEPGKLGAILRRDLDWIVMKAMEKDRTRRYSTASELADDVVRYMRDQPVEAGPPTTLYRLRKFTRRYRTAIAALSAVFLVLCVGLVGTSWALIVALEQRDKARAAEAEAAREAARAQRFSNMAGNPLMRLEQIQKSAAEWQAEIGKLRATFPEDDPNRVRQECQYATWLAMQSVFREDEQMREDGRQLMTDLYERAKKVLGYDDVNFLSLANAGAMNALRLPKEEQVKVMPYYNDLIESLGQVYGISDETRIEIILEKAILFVRAQQYEDAAETLEWYLREYDKYVESPGMTHKYRLRAALRELEAWGAEYPAIFERLKSLGEAAGAEAGNGE